MLALDLSGRTALVTGASGELGRVMVRTLAGCGADVAIHYLKNRDGAKSLAGEVEAMGRRAITVQADVGDKASVAALREAVVADLGEPDIVVTNAVSQYTWKPLLEQDVADYLDQHRTCVVQNVLIAQAFVPGMVARRRGRFIGISTECVMQCWPNQSAYVSAKRGMDGLLRILAKEIGPSGVTVNQVAPGWTISDKYRGDAVVDDSGYVKGVPMKRRGTDQEIANAVAFLASDLASFIHGVYLPVCGGNVMPTV
jgi:3-oxoacyl-[acyl-carrier protein] reductase